MLRNSKTQKTSSLQFEDLLSFNFYQNYKKMLSFAYFDENNFCISKSGHHQSNYNIGVNNPFLHTLDLTVNKNKKNWSSVSKIKFLGESLYEGDSLLFDFISRKKQRFIINSDRDFFSLLSFFDNSIRNAEFTETARWFKRPQGTNSIIRLIKFPVSTKNDFSLDDEVIELFRFRHNETCDYVHHKNMPHSTTLSMKQKRYKRRKFIAPRFRFVKDEHGKATKLVKYNGKPMLFENSFITENDLNATKQYNYYKKKKDRNDLMSVVLSRRMLRTKRTLVLPAHVNVTAITNSYDVIHSWFIPGLGLKMDCIPGRSTHHTFFIDNVGFYYGQCAEVCGRFHHHMPIRICALPFEHFLIWWHSFGLPKLLFTVNKKNYQNYYGFRKFVW